MGHCMLVWGEARGDISGAAVIARRGTSVQPMASARYNFVGTIFGVCGWPFRTTQVSLYISVAALVHMLTLQRCVHRDDLHRLRHHLDHRQHFPSFRFQGLRRYPSSPSGDDTRLFGDNADTTMSSVPIANAGLSGW